MIIKVKKRYGNVKKRYGNIKEIYRNIILSFIIAIVTLFIGLTVSFIFLKLMPGNPVYAFLPTNFTMEQYRAVEHWLGLDQPIIVQYFRYIGRLFTGNWGPSIKVSTGEPVWDLIKPIFPRMIEVSLLPVIIGTGIGILYGRISSRNRGKRRDKFIQILSIFGISIPVFFAGLVLLYIFAYQSNWLPFWGFKNPLYGDPPQITGFRIIDSLLSSNIDLAVDALRHLILPGIILSLITLALITRETRAYMVNKSQKKSVISNTIITGRNIGFVFMFYMLIETTFRLQGFGTLIINAIIRYDYTVTGACLFLIIIIFVIVTFFSNIIFSLYRLRTIKTRTEPVLDDKKNEEKEESAKIGLKVRIKKTLLQGLKSPFIMIGTIVVVFAILVALFPHMLTPYTFNEATGYPTSGSQWGPPSPEHPLGQTIAGRDVLARLIWGVKDSLTVGFGAVLIGLIGGVNLGFIAGRFKRWGYKPIMGIMIILYIFPALILSLLTISIFGIRPGVEVLTLGVILIPSFTLATANAMSREINIYKIFKSVISYIPLNIALTILIHEALGFLGYNTNVIQLGNDIAVASDRMYSMYKVFHTVFWPGFALFMIVMGFLFLHEGLKDKIR